MLELDDDVVFSGRVTTDYRLSLAETVPLSLPEGEHRLRVVVNREASSSREFVAGNVVVIAVRYDDVENDVALDLLVELPLYD